jgi:phage tail tape-measure protein
MHMITKRFPVLLLTAAMLTSLPVPVLAQTDATIHARAKAEQNAYDKRHHNTAKTVGGTAAGGALIGGVAGGLPGAAIGAAAGGGVGYVGDKVRKHHGVKKRERAMRERRRYRG